MPSTPKKKPSQHQRALAKQRAQAVHPAIKSYLILYNLSCAVAWSWVLVRLGGHLLLQQGKGDAGLGLGGGGALVERLMGRSRTSYAE